ncbi:thioredoxin family protein [Pseudotenacibaculum haliotis]|uniref:Thioredoxin family protein n=1 Tax=Pseudotenacibaculum haliotis TaxID=1862138 RepID=A0ABW5LQY0_9FLAO
MKSIKYSVILFLFLGLTLSTLKTSAQAQKINWISFEQLSDSLAIKPKKVFISFYADWCAYCKKMDKVAYRDSKVIEILNAEYYAVKMNAETRDTIVFEGKKFYNKEAGKKRRPTHEIPLLLASRKGRPFSLPAMIVLDEKFRVTGRYFEYLSPRKVINILNEE